MVGTVYKVQPQPPEQEHTRWFDAGPLRFGVEYRHVDPAALEATYAGNAEDMAEIVENSPEGGFFDQGVSIHVCGLADGHEYLRFDVFDDEPHYHYVSPSGDHNNVVEFDVVAQGPMFPWVLDRVRYQLRPMLVKASGAALADQVDDAALADAVVTLERMAEEARRV